MFRIFILIGFTYLFLHLHATGDISKYINMKYSYISEMAIYIFIAFTIICIYNYMKKEKNDHNHHSSCDHCGHNHANEENTWWKRTFTFGILLLPVFTGLFFPVATLDSNIVAKKGLYFPVYDEGDEYSQRQFLQPNTSSYYGKEGYAELMDKGLEKLANKETITLQEDNFLNDLETIYNYPGQFLGKTVTLTGFTFHENEQTKNELFLLRFGIIHCIADSGVYGILLSIPEDIKTDNDQWLEVTGTLDSLYYQSYKKTLPILHVTEWKSIAEPKDPYVYRQY
ncbi:MAG TPA: TIGR03943 family protein [Niallia sp.]|nr:TIGR03943 family protein [Niallia sp.]